MVPIFLVCLFMIHSIDAKFLLSAESSSIIVLRHIRLPTDHEHYRIRCPYHLNHLTLTLLNYSNGLCFDVQTKSINDACLHHRSPCRYHAKPVQLNCHNRPISSHVDITYQCSSAPVRFSRPAFFAPEKTSMSTTMDDVPIMSTPNPPSSITIHALTFPSMSSYVEESIGIFLLGLATVFVLWLTVCCVWFIRCGHLSDEDDGKCELLSFQPTQKTDLVDFTVLSERKSMIVGNLSGHTSTGGLETVCLHVNPIENKRLSSLKITQID